MMTACDSCPHSIAALKPNGFGEWEAARNSFILFMDRGYTGLQSRLFLDHDCPRHLGVNGAKVSVSTGSGCCDCELLIGVERGRFLKLLLDAYDCMRFLVPINPGNLLTRLHGYSLGIKGKVFDLYLGSGSAASVLHFAGEGEERQIEKSDTA